MDGQPVMKPGGNIEEAKKCLDATKCRPTQVLQRRFLFKLLSRGGMQINDQLNLVKGLGPVLQMLKDIP